MNTFRYRCYSVQYSMVTIRCKHNKKISVPIHKLLNQFRFSLVRYDTNIHFQ
ncbi:hypothetical protein Hanom_Chr14g01321781 [Helianthus anomalus]